MLHTGTGKKDVPNAVAPDRGCWLQATPQPWGVGAGGRGVRGVEGPTPRIDQV